MGHIHAPTRLWTADDLEKAVAGDLELATLLLNAGTYNEDMIRAHNKIVARGVKTYEAWYPEDECFSLAYEFHALNDELALWFLDQTMTTRPDDLQEVITTYRKVA